MHGYGTSSYGDGFADVYDEWYTAESGHVDPPDATAAFVADLTDGPILELGSGTGRLAGPLHARGLAIVGLDASVPMLERSRLRIPDLAVVAADMAAPPVQAGLFGVVLIAFNSLFNLDTEGQRHTLAGAARAAAPGGAVVVEAFVPGEQAGDATDRVDVTRLEVDSVVLRVSRNVPDGPSSGTVFGHHVELRDGEPVRLRPWQVCYRPPDAIDACADAVGLRLEERWADWDRTPFTPASAKHVSVYRAKLHPPVVSRQ